MKKLLPPMLFIIFVLVIGLICWGTGSHHLLIYPYNLAGLLLIAAGLMLAAAGKQHFKKLKANIMTFDEPTVLVTEGLYQYSRNPMYLGFVIAMIGFSVLMGAALLSFLLTLLFIIIMDKWYISFEEKMMHAKFGNDYKHYCRKVRRWL